MPQMLAVGYRDALAQVLEETGLPEQTFRGLVLGSLEQIMAEDFWPER